MQHKSNDINDLFSGKDIYPLDNLSKSNRWVILADNMCWSDIEAEYNKRLKNQKSGAGNKPARLVIGALIIKHLTCLSDEETIVTISENPYMQYLVGLKYFTSNPICSPELFVHVRKRIDDKFFNTLTQSLEKKHSDKDKDNSDGNAPISADESTITIDEDNQKHSGVMKIDATCTDAEVRYPTDVYLIEDASREIERLSQKLCARNGMKQQKSNRGNVRSAFVLFLKKKHKGTKLVNSTKERMLHFLSLNIKHFTDLIGRVSTDVFKCFNRTDIRNFKTLKIVFEQQKMMFKEKVHSCLNRIVSIFQPHIRPIVRGKAKAKVEFGAKVGLSVVDGYSYVDHVSWDAYNESSDMLLQIELYRERFGYYPQEIQADKIYLNKQNRAALKRLHIDCHCSPLGRPPKITDPQAIEERRKASASRNEVEAAFGTAKRIFRANNIRAKLPETSLSWIGACFYAKNLKKFLKELLWLIFQIMSQNKLR